MVAQLEGVVTPICFQVISGLSESESWSVCRSLVEFPPNFIEEQLGT